MVDLSANGLGLSSVRLNGAITATEAFEQNVAATPIGMLNLERLEMTPAGIEMSLPYSSSTRGLAGASTSEL